MKLNQKKPSFDFELPEAPDFKSVPPDLSFAENFRLNEEALKSFPLSSEEENRRWKSKVSDEFKL